MIGFLLSLPAFGPTAKVIIDTHNWPVWGKLLWACFCAVVALAVIGLAIRWITIGFFFLVAMIQLAVEAIVKGICRMIWWPMRKTGQLVARGGKAILRISR